MEIREGYKKADIGVIPKDWNYRELKDITEVLKCGIASTPKYVNNGVPFLSAQNVKENRLLLDKFQCISQEFHEKLTKNVKPQRNDILLTRVGAGFGETTIVDTDMEFSVYVSLTHIRMKPDYYPLFYVYLLNSDQYREIARKSIYQGGGVPNLNVKVVEKYIVPIPPLPEQQAIAAALSDVDELISSLTKLIDKKKKIKQGAMQELLTGKRRLNGFCEDWEVKTLGEICEIKDGTHQTPNYVYTGIPFYSVESVTQNEFEKTKFITVNEHIALTKSYKIEKGDILMTRIGSIGVCKFVDWDVNASFYVSLALLKVKKGFDGKFISQYSNTDYFKKEIELNSLQSAIPKKINLGNISNVKLLIPIDEQEQIEIVHILSDMDYEIEKLEQKLNKYKRIKQGMMQKLLTGRIRLV